MIQPSEFGCVENTSPMVLERLVWLREEYRNLASEVAASNDCEVVAAYATLMGQNRGCSDAIRGEWSAAITFGEVPA